MAVHIVDALEVVKVNVDDSEDAGGIPCLADEPFKMLFKREAILDVGEQVKLGAMDQVRVHPPGFNGESGEFRRACQRLVLFGVRLCTGVKGGVDGTQGRTAVGADATLDDAQACAIRLSVAVAEFGSIRNLAPAGRAFQTD